MRVKPTDQSSKKVRSLSMTDLVSLVKSSPSAGKKSTGGQGLVAKKTNTDPHQQDKPNRPCYSPRRSSLTPSASLLTLPGCSLTQPHIAREKGSAPVQITDPVFAPAQSSDPRSTLAQGNDPKSCPAQGTNPRLAPVHGNDLRSTPVQRGDPRLATVHGSELSFAPVQGSDSRSFPAQGSNPKSTSVHRSDPMLAHVQSNTTSLTPVHGSDPKCSPTQRIDPRLAPIQSNSARSTPEQSSEPRRFAVQGGDLRSTPLQANDPRYFPVQGADPKFAPFEGRDQISPTVQRSDPSLVPLQGNKPKFAPVQGTDPRSTPVQRSDPKVVLVHGSDLRFDLFHDSNARSTPVHGIDPKLTPIQGSDPRSTPVQRSDPISTPVQQSGSKFDPCQSSTPRSTPFQRSYPMFAPVQGSDSGFPPVPASDHRSTPVQGSSAPLQRSDQRSAPAKGSNQRSAPAKGSNQRSAPAKGSNQRSAPAKGTNQRSAPAKGTNQRSAPAKGSNQRSAPAKGSNQRSAPAKRRYSYSDTPPCQDVKSGQVSKPCSMLLSRRVRSLLLRTSSSDSTPSPPRRRVRSYRTRRYRSRLWLYRMLAVQRRQIRLIQETDKAMAKALESSSCTPECLGSLSRIKKRKRSSPSSQSPPEMKKPSRKSGRRLWRRQLDSSSSDSPVSEKSTVVTPVCASAAGPERKPGLTQSKPRKTRVTFSEKKSVATNCTLLDFDFLGIDSNDVKKATTKATPSGILKTVKFSDSSSPGSPHVARLQLSDFQNKLRMPSTPHVCKSSKAAKCPKGSAATKGQMQCKNCFEATGKGAADKSGVTPKSLCSVKSAPKMVPLAKSAPRSSKKGKSINQTTSQRDTRLVIRPQSTKMLKKNPATVTPLNKPFRKPDTPRPKSCVKTPEWNRALEPKTTVQDEQKCVGSPRCEHLIALPQNQSISKITAGLFKENVLSGNSGALRGPVPDTPVPSGVRDAAPREPVEPRDLSTPRPSTNTQTTPESSTVSSQVMSRAVLSTMSFLMSVQSAEPDSISIVCSRPDPFRVPGFLDTRNQRESLGQGECQYYAVSIKPLDLQASRNQESCHFVECRSSCSAEGGDNASQRLETPAQSRNG